GAINERAVRPIASLANGASGAHQCAANTERRRRGINIPPFLVAQFIGRGEVALAVLLLVGAGLLINSLVRLQRVQPGLDIDKLLTVELSLPRARYADAAKIKAFTEDLIQRVE